MSADSESNSTDEKIKEVLEDEWIVKECDTYKDEYDECTKFKSRFHQYFIYGETLDCNQWKKDYNNCCKWKDSKDLKAGAALIESEKARRKERLLNHYQNDTWKKRASPPSDFSKPLPEWMVKRDENSYLAIKADEMRNGTDEQENTSSCTIM